MSVVGIIDHGPGQSLGINVVFTPQSAVEFAGEVIVSTTDPLAPQVRASVIGRGEGPLFVVQPDAVNFGVQREMITHRRSLLLINAGSSDVTVQSVSLDRNAALVGARAGLALGRDTRLSLDYNGLLGSKEKDHGVGLTLAWQF